MFLEYGIAALLMSAKRLLSFLWKLYFSEALHCIVDLQDYISETI
jgi:hypothetical protein